MPNQKRQWGIAFPVTAALLAAGCSWFVASVPAYAHPALFGRALPLAGLALSLIGFVVSHFSYPRIHNLKVYLGGFLTSLVGLAYFGLDALPAGFGAVHVPEGFLRALYFLVLVNGVAVPLVPSFVKYRVTIQLTWTVLAIEGLLLLWVRFVPQARMLTGFLGAHGGIDVLPWVAVAWAAAVTVLALRFVPSEFYLGGLLSGCAILYASALIVPVFLRNGRGFETLIVATAVLFYVTGIMVHWLARMEHRVAYDPLLHIYNREYCTQILAEQSNINTLPPFAVAMVDIDHFKKVNDTHGHQAGDHVLYGVAQTVSREVVPDGVVCRYGGEELVVFYPQRTSSDVRQLMEQVRLAVQKNRFPAGKKHIGVTISCGISHRTEREQPLADVVAAADKALYRAKEGGRNQVRIAATQSTADDDQTRTPRVTRTMRAVEKRPTPRTRKVG